ncbi:MAG: GerW family sporulation protein [Bacillota bacterium]
MAEQHPIQTLMQTAMENLKEMIDVNKVVGDAVETPDGHVIIPVSKVSFGFVAGGSEFEGYGEEVKKTLPAGRDGFPFGGGSGGGVSLRPVAFLVAGPGEIRLLPVDRGAAIDRIIDAAPQLIKYIQGFLAGRGKKEDKEGCPRI